MADKFTQGGVRAKFRRCRDWGWGRRPRGDSWNRGEAPSAVGEGLEAVERRCTAVQGLGAAELRERAELGLRAAAVRRDGGEGVRGGATYRAAANLGVRARFGRPARSQVGVAGGRCGRKVTSLASGVGLTVAGERDVAGEAGRGLGCSWASALARARALGRGEGRGCWARGERLGRLGLGSGKREGGSDGPDWVGFWFQVGLGFLFFSFYFFSFLNLNQTKFEFKYKFEFKPHSNKCMHQHECNTKFKPMINFNYS